MAERSPATDPEREETCPAWASDLLAPALVGDAPRILLDEFDGIEVWALVTHHEAEQLVDGMEDWPTESTGRHPGA